MAVICPKFNLLFICIPKTGSTAVSRWLIRHFGGCWLPPDHLWDETGNTIRVSFKHSTVSELLESGILSPERLRELTVVAVMRNPFDRVLSDFLSVKSLYHKHKHEIEAYEAGGTFDRNKKGPMRWMVSRLDRVRDAGEMEFDGYVRKYFANKKFSTANNFTAGADAVFLRYENLQADTKVFFGPLAGCDLPALEWVNKTAAKDRPYWEYYTPACQKMMEEAFQNDLERFHYKFGPPQPCSL
ncbi:MAG: hypothetical protein A2Z83_04940 [Omnitrophica bacterium GWA2_52_8]|nr:MAG: hypothetical protein A2Z83_04940 [Omnitrophica bacterium GWA2_52_8]